ncbi:sigma-70 family RNA polymerase sigma factor [Streptomyces sp. NPDC005438]|uniref:sigma-70 family RNA polymerase sigma factor n=1 Tax=Streptomyces sp. NPDC005438 TaxID=3156880 RepID=UPI0033AE4A3D
MSGEREVAMVKAARAGDQRAQDQLVAAYLPLVYNIVGRALNGHADVDDVTQETMIRVLSGLGNLRDPEGFRSWLVAITMNQIRDHFRRSGTVPIPREDLADSHEVADPGADFVDLTIVRLGLSGQRREVAEATRWLDEDDRALLSLWWLEAAGELSRGELAHAMELSPQHAAVRVQRMKAQLETARVVVRALAVRPGCLELERQLAPWDGVPSALWRKRVARHTRECGVCAGHWSGLVPAEGLLVGLALVPLGVGLVGWAPEWEPTAAVVRVGGRAEARRRRTRGRRRVGALVAALAVLGTGGATYLLLGPDDDGPADTVASVPSRSAEVSASSSSPSPSTSTKKPGKKKERKKAEPKKSGKKTAERPRPSRTSAPAGPPSSAKPRPSRTQQPPPPSGDGPQVLALVNKERAARGCGALRLNDRLNTAGQRHSDDMAARGYFSHTSPDGKDPGDRITAAGYRWSTYAENIARGQGSPAQVMKAWMDSSGHRANILNCSLKEMGLGVHQGAGGPWWTQVFGTAA